MSFTRYLLPGLAGILLAAPCAAHPTFNSNSVVNAASYMPVELPGGNIARGSIFTIFGDQMGPPEGIGVSAFPLQRELGSVSVTVRQGNRIVDAIPLFANNFQVNAIMPSDAPLGEVAITITFPGTGGSSFFPALVRVVPASFGIFTINSTGSGPAVIQNFIAPGNEPLNSTRQSARPGQFVTLWGTGLGAISAPDTEKPPVGNLASVQVLVGDRQVQQILYFGRTPCCAGVDQIVFQVPQDVPLGCYVPVVVQAAPSITSNVATMSITKEGGVCKDSANAFAGVAAGDGPRLGRVLFTRNSLQLDAGRISVTDGAVAAFESVINPNWFFVPAVSMPALGTCVSFFSRGGSIPLTNPPPLQPIDAGVELIVRGPNGPRSIPRTNPGFYASLLATYLGPNPGAQQPALYLDPGMYTLESTSGTAVGPLQASLELPAPIQWTNQGEIRRIDRQQGIFLTWSGGDPQRQFVRILGVSESSPTPANNVSGAFVCSVPLELGSFMVPPSVLANLPPSVSSGSTSTGLLLLGTSPKLDAPNVQADGLDFGFVTYQSMSGKFVLYP